MAHIFNDEQLMMHKIWRKALREGKVELTLPVPGQAVRLRFGLYNSLKLIRSGKVIDQELMDAADNCSISIEGNLITVYQRALSPIAQAMLAALGDDLEELVSPETVTLEEDEVAKSLRMLDERLKAAEGQEAERVTPYYKRGD